MKFETKNKPDLFCYNGTEYYSDGGASFEWLIDKLRDSGAFGLKKNETIHIEDYTLGASYDPIPYDYIYPGGRGSPEKGYYNARVVIDATKLYEARDEYPEVVRVSPELREKVSKKFPGLFNNLR